MRMIISNQSSVPLYEQIKNTMREAILSGELKEDERLPSIRAMAKELKVAILTVKKAYDELEAEGYLISRQGLGSFVAPKNLELEREEQQKEMESYLSKAAALAVQLDIPKTTIFELLAYIYESDHNE